MSILEKLKRYCEGEISVFKGSVTTYAEMKERCYGAMIFATELFDLVDPKRWEIISWWNKEMSLRLDHIKLEKEV